MSLAWRFTHGKFSWVEVLLLSIASVALFFLFWIYFPWLISLALTVFFIAGYFLISHGVKVVRKKEMHYRAKDKHLHVTKAVEKKIVKERIPLHKAKDCKFDKFRLKGVLINHDGKKHHLHFNSKDEMRKFRKHLHQHMKPKKVKKPKKKKRKTMQEHIRETRKKLRSV